MMDDLVEFLRARYDDERAVAERLAARYVYPADHELAGQSYWPRPTVRAALRSTDDEDAAALIGAFSPARVLAEVDAKRRIIAEYERMASTTYTGAETASADIIEPFIRILAQVYADHPDYRQEWRP